MFDYFKKQFKNLLGDKSTSSKSSEKRDNSEPEALSDEEKGRVLAMVKAEREEELNHPPTIAIIGKTGVGKSSTINSLFNTNLGVSHFEACTQKAIPVTISNGKGTIIIYDMPGLGEDEEKDEEHKIEYKRILPTCDVVLWIMNIADREMSSQQGYIKHIMTYLEGRLVVCANKADMVHPEDWNTVYNLPSNAQEDVLNKRIIDIKKKIQKACPTLNDETIVYYSATKRYKLDILFGAMLSACPINRGWVLNDRVDLADFTELIDKEVLKRITNGK